MVRVCVLVCVHYTEARNNAVPFMVKEEAVESPARSDSTGLFKRQAPGIIERAIRRSRYEILLICRTPPCFDKFSFASNRLARRLDSSISRML